MERHGSVKNSCNAKDGNPFGSFWNTFNIDFDDSVFYGPLSYNTQNAHIASEWNKRYNMNLICAFKQIKICVAFELNLQKYKKCNIALLFTALCCWYWQM